MSIVLDRSRPPASARPGAFHLPASELRTQANGTRLRLLEQRRSPLVTLRLLLPAGGHFDPIAQPGLAAFTTSLVDEGTLSRSAQEIAELIESLGGTMSVGVRWSTASITTATLAEHLPVALDLLADVATRPAFEHAEVERIRRNRLAEWLRRRDDPSALAQEAFIAAVYGETAYGHSLLGSRESLESIERSQLADFWRQHSSARGASLLAVGDFESERLAGLAEGLLADLPDHAPPSLPAIEPPPRRRTVRIVDRPGAAQTELRVGHAGPPRTHPDKGDLQVLNSLLGGKFTSRINLNLREKNGFTYGAHSTFVDRSGPGPFVVRTAVANEVAGAATREVLSELARLHEEDVKRAELEEAIDYLRGVFPYGLQTQGGLLHHIEELELYDLPEDYFDRLLEGLDSIDARRLRELAQTHIHPGDATIVAVGPAALLEPQLGDLGATTVTEHDSKAS